MFSGKDSIVPLPPPTQLFATVPTVGKLCRCRTRVPPAAMSPVSFCSFSQECQKSDLGRTLETGTLEQERDTQEQEVRAQPKFKPRPKWPEWPSWSLRAQGCSASPTARGYSCHTGTTVLHGEWSCFGKWEQRPWGWQAVQTWDSVPLDVILTHQPSSEVPALIDLTAQQGK